MTTYNLEKGKITKIKINTRDLQKEKISQYMDRYRIAVPGLKDGTVFEYSYIIKTERIFKSDRWYFQGDLPVVHSSFVLQYPDYFKYKFKTENISEDISPKIEKRSENIPTRNGTIEMPIVTCSMEMNNIKPIEKESYMPPVSHLAKSLLYELNSIEIGNSFTFLSSTWSSIVKFYNERLALLTKSLGTGSHLKNYITQAVGNETDNLKKVEKIYYFVQQHTEWNGIYSSFPSNGFIKAFNIKANSATINYLLIEMLKEAGFNAYPVLISTRDEGRLYKDFPSMSSLNNMLAAVRVDGKLVLMDAATSLTPFGYLPINDLNEYGLPLAQIGGNLIPISSLYNDGKLKTVVSAKMESDDLLKGSLTKRYVGYEEIKERAELMNVEDREEYFKPDNFDISNFQVNNLDDIKKNLDVKFDFSTPVVHIDSSIFIDPLLGLGMSNPFKASERKYPVDFVYPFEYDYIITIQIPEGYKIKSVPKPARVVMPDNSGSYLYYVQQRGNMLQIIVKLTFGKTYFATDQYEVLKKFFSAVEDYQHQKIELVK